MTHGMATNGEDRPRVAGQSSSNEDMLGCCFRAPPPYSVTGSVIAGRAVCIILGDRVPDGESIFIVIPTAGIRYANVTQTHIRAPADSWSCRGDKLKMRAVDR
jgi:hypothetical protein